MSELSPTFQGIRTLRFYISEKFEESWAQLKPIFYHVQWSNKEPPLPYLEFAVPKFQIEKDVYLIEVNNDDCVNFNNLKKEFVWDFKQLYESLKKSSKINSVVKIKLEKNPYLCKNLTSILQQSRIPSASDGEDWIFCQTCTLGSH